ncbi:copper chaperone PCu(A)C [Allopontixanthobacter sediminis]|uniref:Copper chaperone PCu(A)C n=1 Tax=Allopontixanthobacter sediminis TaxID=1689985 RepID=A0A845AVQ7_9SPHN|nr:copper chaperone PCu(A)C [Allopontixanthobacter sediminis]MXP43633.1 copper chaperone PCu(A)C [Allopontixanthobacter sediminis]
MTKTFFAALALTTATLALGACGESAPEQTAAPDAVPGLSVTNARMVLNAVEGQPAAIYLDLNYAGDKNVAVNRVAVDGAESAVMHEMGEWDGGMEMMEMLPIVMKKGDVVKFEPGAKHIMVMGVSPELQAGGTTEATFIIAGGDKISFPVEIRGAGEDR